MSDPADILRRAHMSDSATIRSRAARLSVDLDELEALVDGPDPDRERRRRVAALRAERFPTPTRLATL